jgi:hypothetical protein
VSAAVPGSAAERMLVDFDLKRRWLAYQRKLNIEKMLTLLDVALGFVNDGNVAQGRRLASALLKTVEGPEAAYSVAVTQCFRRRWGTTKKV